LFLTGNHANLLFHFSSVSSYHLHAGSHLDPESGYRMYRHFLSLKPETSRRFRTYHSAGMEDDLFSSTHGISTVRDDNGILYDAGRSIFMSHNLLRREGVL
jgi:hypothetical protein